MTWGSLCCILLSARGNVRAIHHTDIDYIVFTLKTKLDFKLFGFFSEGRQILMKWHGSRRVVRFQRF